MEEYEEEQPHYQKKNINLTNLQQIYTNLV